MDDLKQKAKDFLRDNEVPEGATHYSPEYKDCREGWFFKWTIGSLFVWVDGWSPTNYASPEMISLNSIAELTEPKDQIEPTYPDDFEMWLEKQADPPRPPNMDYYLYQAAWNASRLSLMDKAYFSDDLMAACKAIEDCTGSIDEPLVYDIFKSAMAQYRKSLK